MTDAAVPALAGGAAFFIRLMMDSGEIDLKRALYSGLFLFFLATVTAFADQYDSCRCTKGLATIGDSKQEVSAECGLPLKTEYGYVRVRGKRMFVEKWVYNFGPSEFMQSIAFDNNNKIVIVESLQTGF